MRRDRITFAMMLGVPLMQLVLFGFAINNDPKSLPAALVTTSNDRFTPRHGLGAAGDRLLPLRPRRRAAPAEAEALMAKRRGRSSSSPSRPTSRGASSAATTRRC